MEEETPMKSRSRLLINAGFLVVAMLHAVAADVKVIANPNVKADSISAAELRSVYLLQRRTLKDGSSVEPVLCKSGPVHQAFLKQYIHRDSEEIRIYYQGLVFTGKGSMPKELNSDAEVVVYVARTKGAIGYVAGSTNTQGAKELAVISEESKGERTPVKRVEPDYPETLQRLGIGGSVRLELTISPKGTVESVAILGGNPILAEAAAKAVKQWVYAPGPSQTHMQVIVPFEPRP
jgi:TonB family protein